MRMPSKDKPMTTISNKTFDQERALYGEQDLRLEKCRFAGPADGESALKEVSNIQAIDCEFELRYPLWHLHKGSLTNCHMTETCRAALWYAHDVTLTDCRLHGIKVVRECDRIAMKKCEINSQEFGWFCRHLDMYDCRLVSEYPFLRSSGLTLEELNMRGKYSFQYVSDSHLAHCVLDTKDAFWHCHNVTVEDCLIKGEYLAWYSDGLTLINCHIEGTQPLCYCRNLKLINCTMLDCDLAFENSEVQADIKGHIASVKRPRSGEIVADSIGGIIDAQALPGQDCRISERQL